MLNIFLCDLFFIISKTGFASLQWYTYDVQEDCLNFKNLPPPPYTSKVLLLPRLWTSTFERMPRPQMMTNQLKEIMIQGWLLYVINKVTTEFSSSSMIAAQTSLNGALARISAMITIGITSSSSFSSHSYPQFPHWEWVERQEPVDLVACALSHIRINASDVWPCWKPNFL